MSDVVVDIHGLNKISKKDSYPLPLQVDITASVRGASYFWTVDCTGFFYQWQIEPEDPYKLIVATYWGQEPFDVVVMGYCTISPHVQRQVDTLLQSHHAYAKAYADDIMIWLDTLEEHISHLQTVFLFFQQVQIGLSPAKFFIGYPSVKLLRVPPADIGAVSCDGTFCPSSHLSKLVLYHKSVL